MAVAKAELQSRDMDCDLCVGTEKSTCRQHNYEERQTPSSTRGDDNSPSLCPQCREQFIVNAVVPDHVSNPGDLDMSDAASTATTVPDPMHPLPDDASVYELDMMEDEAHRNAIPRDAHPSDAQQWDHGQGLHPDADAKFNRDLAAVASLSKEACFEPNNEDTLKARFTVT